MLVLVYHEMSPGSEILHRNRYLPHHQFLRLQLPLRHTYTADNKIIPRSEINNP